MSEPVAWAVEDSRGVWFTRVRREDADEAYGRAVAFSRETGRIVPLYPQPTLTDEERAAVTWYAAYGAGDHAATLCALLSRTGSDLRQTRDSAPECGSQGEKLPERDRITEAERWALKYFAAFHRSPREGDAAAAATLRALLARLSPPAT